MSFTTNNIRRLGNQISVAIPKDDAGFLGASVLSHNANATSRSNQAPG